MAGHSRTVDTGRARRTPRGKSRRVRQHLPPGEADQAHRDKHRRGARAVAEHRMRRTSDPLAQLDAAREYVRSAAAKYRPAGHTTEAVEALLAAGDRIYQHGVPRRKQV